MGEKEKRRFFIDQLGISDGFCRAVVRGDKNFRFEKAEKAGVFTNSEPSVWQKKGMGKERKRLFDRYLNT